MKFTRLLTCITFVLAAAIPSGVQAFAYTRPVVDPAPVPVVQPPDMPWMSAQPVELIRNGSFEPFGLSFWTQWNQSGSYGEWMYNTGTMPKLSELGTIPAAPHGTYQALADVVGPGTHIFYQDVTIPTASTAELNLVLWYVNRASGFASPPTLDYLQTPNQQIRVDLMNPAAPVNDVSGGVLLALFATTDASPLFLPYTVVHANLDAYAGQTVRLRFALAQNQYFIHFGVDAVSLRAQPLVPASTTSWGATKDRYRD